MAKKKKSRALEKAQASAKVVTTVRIPPDLWAHVAEKAEASRKSNNDIIIELIRQDVG